MSATRQRPNRPQSAISRKLQQSKEQYKSGNEHKAIRTLKNLLFHLYRGKYNYKAVSENELSQVYGWVMDLKSRCPDNERVYLLEALFSARQGMIASALELYWNVNLKFPFYDEAFKRHIDLLQSRGLDSEAEVISMAEKSVFKYELYALDDQSIAMIQQYIQDVDIFKFDPDFYVWSVVADRYKQGENWMLQKEAAEVYQPRLNNPAFNEIFQSIYEHLKTDKMRVAIHEFNVAFAQDNVEARNWKPAYYGKEFANLGTEDMMKIFKAVAGFRAMHPGWPASEALLATFYAKVGFYDESLKILNELKQTHPRDELAYNLHAQIMISCNAPISALEILKQKKQALTTLPPVKKIQSAVKEKELSFSTKSRKSDSGLWNFRLFPALKNWQPSTPSYADKLKTASRKQ